MTLKDEATAFRLLEGSKANAAERYVSELAAGVKRNYSNRKSIKSKRIYR